MIEFKHRSFCFTGKLADLKRSQAEREARARGGLSTETVNERLNYLVVGSIPSPGWKHGTYGTKIEAARALQSAHSQWPLLVSEDRFLESLALVPPENSGAIDSQVFVATYRFVSPDLGSFDRSAVESLLKSLAEDESLMVRARAHPVWMRKDLFGETGATSGHVVEVRLVKQTSLDAALGSLVESIERGFEAIEGVDGILTWFTRKEGSADYIRLIRELPSSHRIE
jgi:hypothetical protein